MRTWKREYEGFPRGFILWCWERQRVVFLMCTASLIGGVVVLGITFAGVWG